MPVYELHSDGFWVFPNVKTGAECRALKKVKLAVTGNERREETRFSSPVLAGRDFVSFRKCKPDEIACEDHNGRLHEVVDKQFG